MLVPKAEDATTSVSPDTAEEMLLILTVNDMAVAAKADVSFILAIRNYSLL
jgi:hypothetical protein